MKIHRFTTWALTACAGLAVSMAAPSAHSATLSGQLGILDLTANGGINPATGVAWKAGDTYHLIYVTTATRNAESTDITDYNAFVQADANNQNITINSSTVNLGSISWTALASTGTVDAIDNSPITGPVFDVYNSVQVTGNAFIALDSDDFWDFLFPPSTGGNQNNPLSNLSGGDNNVWTGTRAGGDASSALGEGSSSRRHWTGWWNWDAPFNTNNNSDLLPMVAISQQLTVIPEPSTALLIGLGGLALLRRRR